MNTLRLVSSYGEINSAEINNPEIDGSLGKMQLTMGTIDEGETFGWLVIINFPKIIPRVAVAKEDRNVKAGN